MLGAPYVRNSEQRKNDQPPNFLGAADEQVGQSEAGCDNSYRSSAVKPLVGLAADHQELYGLGWF